MSETTARHALPLIQPGQAQKELVHNEALAVLDMIVQPAVVAVGTETPPGTAEPGACWALGPNPTGAWTGRAHALAGWTAGGWRFVAPTEGMMIRVGDGVARWDGTGWSVMPRGAGIPDPAGGATSDAEARAAIAAILTVLRQHGLIAA